MDRNQMDEKEIVFLRLPDVLKIFPVSRAQWWAGVKKQIYPAPIRSGHMTFWKKADVIELCKKIEEENRRDIAGQ